MDPNIAGQRKGSVSAAIEETKAIYHRNFFPWMKVNWRAYPNNIGHMIFDGCFRCHDGKHAGSKGLIRQDCTICHDFLQPVQTKPTEVFREIVPAHPVKLVGLHESLKCNACHTGGLAPANSCEGCHLTTSAFRKGTSPKLPGIVVPPPVMADLGCDSCHNDLTRPQNQATIAPLCESCHQKGYGDLIQIWKDDASSGRQKAAAAIAELQTGLQDNRFSGSQADAVRELIPQLQNALDEVDKAGAQHNIIFADAIYAQIIQLTSQYTGTQPVTKK